MTQLESSAIRGYKDESGSNSDAGMDQVDIFLRQTENLEKLTRVITNSRNYFGR